MLIQFAQQGRDRLRIGMGGQDLVDGVAETDQPAAHGPAFDLEGGREIVSRHGNGGGLVIGHGGSLNDRLWRTVQDRKREGGW